jgi:DNA-binding Lrp family transcriptional regulator
MSESVVGASVIQDLRSPPAWETTRASLAYIRDTAQISRGDGDLLDPLIFTAILDANMAPVNRDPELRVAYGGPDISAPDALRRPVSINAVAQSLSLPFETVRRRVTRLVREGQCVMDGRGVIVPNAAVTSPAYVAIQRGRYDRARRFYQTLKTVGVLPADGLPAPMAPTAPPLIRAADRALSAYMLRASNDLIALTGDALSSLILVQLALDNTKGLAADDLLAWTADPVGLSHPVRIAQLSKALRFSPETTRRHILGLENAGFCLRHDRTFCARVPVTRRAETLQFVIANLANVQRLFGALRQLEVLAAWDTPDEAWPAAVA